MPESGNAHAAQERAPQPVSTATKFFIDVRHRLVVVKFGKKISAADIADYATHLRANSSFQPEFSEICDLTEAVELDLQADDFFRLADEIDPFSTEAKRAFVVRSAVQKHAARMHKILRTQRNIEIFQSFQAAERWIKS